MRQPDNLPAFCRVHRNGRQLIGYDSVLTMRQNDLICSLELIIAKQSPAAQIGGSRAGY